MTTRFHVALTADFFDDAGAPKYQGLNLSTFADQAQIKATVFERHRPQIGSDQVAGAQGVIVLTPAVTAETVSKADDLLVLARFGVGYDNVDVAACTANHVLVTITTGAVDRPVAEATVGWMIALSHHMRIKDQLVRTGQWHERSKYMGKELRERTFGTIGLGGIARKTIELLSGFGMQPPLAFDPFATPEHAAKLGVRLVTLDTLLREADFVSIHCPLTPRTRGLIGARELSLMKPEAVLLNTARGGIVDEDALYQVLKGGRIAGAAIDCFAEEPVLKPHRFAEFENVLLAPHSIAWTDEMFRDVGRATAQVMIELSHHRRPPGVLNPEVLARPEFQRKWARFAQEGSA
jgi:phosphoglycerate dehydrogenase-like enzyme